MTIRPGQEWGRIVVAPAGLVVATSDAEVADAIAAGRPVAVGGGDLARTLGDPRFDGRTELNELPIDLVEVTLGDARPVRGVAHVVARLPRAVGGMARGPVLAVMNAQYLGAWDVAPRGHPGDGRVETFLVDASMPLRQRLAARRKAVSGRHVPHPMISVGSVRQASWSFAADLDVFVDGRRIGRGRELVVAVIADAAVVYA